MNGCKTSIEIFVLPAVSRTLVQTSTPTALQKKRRSTKCSVRRSSIQTASSPVTLWWILTLFLGTASTTCVNTTAWSQLSVTTSRRMLRPVRAQVSPLAGGTAPSAVSFLIPRLNISNIQILNITLINILAFSTAKPCPPNSHFSECTPPCPPTCSDLFPIFCHLPPTTCVEGCQCDANHVLSDNKCVRLDQCGCLDSDREYHDVSVRSMNQYDIVA